MQNKEEHSKQTTDTRAPTGNENNANQLRDPHILPAFEFTSGHSVSESARGSKSKDTGSVWILLIAINSKKRKKGVQTLQHRCYRGAATNARLVIPRVRNNALFCSAVGRLREGNNLSPTPATIKVFRFLMNLFLSLIFLFVRVLSHPSKS